MLKRKHFYALALAAFLCVPASYAAKQWAIPQTNYYLTAEQQQFADFKAPPAPGSEEDLTDLAVLRDWQIKRTEAQCAAANAESKAKFEEFFGDISPFQKPLPKAVKHIMKRVGKDTDSVVSTIKERYKRPRPFRRVPDLEPCLGRIGGLAYPSGHATISRVYALILSDLAPEHRAEFLARADEGALYRVIGGVHHPSDIEAGKRLAEALYQMYLKSPEFQKDMQTMREHTLKVPAASAN